MSSRFLAINCDLHILQYSAYASYHSGDTFVVALASYRSIYNRYASTHNFPLSQDLLRLHGGLSYIVFQIGQYLRILSLVLRSFIASFLGHTEMSSVKFLYMVITYLYSAVPTR